jgi:hypothetical protein
MKSVRKKIKNEEREENVLLQRESIAATAASIDEKTSKSIMQWGN